MNIIEMLLQFFAGMAVIAVACAIFARIAESVIDWLADRIEKRLARRRPPREPVVFLNGNPLPEYDRALIFRSHNDNG